jgi:hypothetical protein
MDLPKVNPKRLRAEIAKDKFKIELSRLIEDFEKREDYKFLPYELDSILLERVQRNHEHYLKKALGPHAL